MNTIKLSIATLAAITLLAGIAAPGVTRAETAPDFTLETIEGDRLTLSDALDHGPVVLDFWATWCKPCRKGLPALQALARDRDDGVSFWTVSIDDPRSRARIGPTLRALGVDLPALIDGDKEVAALYRVTSVPATFLIAPDGTVAYEHVGYRDGDTDRLAAALAELLDGTVAR